jgi:hypothetical protein
LVRLRRFAGLSTIGEAQTQNSVPATDAQPLPVPAPAEAADHALPPLLDPTPRIKYLHDRLRIIAEQEPLWEPVAQTIRDDLRCLYRMVTV